MNVGNRNKLLYNTGKNLLANGVHIDEVTHILLDKNNNFKTPLTTVEIVEVIEQLGGTNK